MFSPFSSALKELDGSLQNVHTQIESLGAALEVNDDRLIHSLADARQHAGRLRDMLRAERPNAHWDDRRALGQLVHELEMEVVAKARRNQQRRDKLLELADELDEGSVKHRFDTRTTALNALRFEAVGELRSEAGAAENVKELPGPEAGAWLGWACGLLEARDAAVLAELRLNFPNLERFAGEMEEGYWAPSPARAKTLARTVFAADNAEGSYALEVYREDGQQSPSDDREPWQQAQDTPAEFYKISHTASYDLSLSPSHTSGPASAVSDQDSDATNTATHEPHATASAADDEALLEVIASAPHVKICEMCGGTFPAQFKICPFDGSDLQPLAAAAPPAATAPPADKRKALKKSLTPTGTASASEAPVPKSQPGTTDSVMESGASHTAEQATVDDVQEPAEVEFERLKTILQHNSGGEEFQFQLLDKVVPRRKLVMGFGAAAGVALLCVALGFAYRSSGVSVSKLRSTVLAASADVAGIAPTVADSDIQRDIEKKLALLSGSTIQANVEKGIVTLAGRSSSEWEALHAESLASQTPGVKRVKNEVEVDTDAPSAGTKKPHGKAKTEAKAKPLVATGK